MNPSKPTPAFLTLDGMIDNLRKLVSAEKVSLAEIEEINRCNADPLVAKFVLAHQILHRSALGVLSTAEDVKATVLPSL
jgi:hypothetical protein